MVRHYTMKGENAKLHRMIERLKDALHFLFNVKQVIEWGGLTMICSIVFAETGFFAFLPGDSLLVGAGIFARTGHLNLVYLLTLVPVCAVIGDQLGYAIGRKAGEALYSRPDSIFFKKEHLTRTHDFYERYGAKTIVIARFVPIVRTFAPLVAGIGRMEYKRFVSYNVIGGVGWVWAMTLTGYCLASLVPNIEKRIDLLMIGVVFLSTLPAVIEFWRERQRAHN